MNFTQLLLSTVGGMVLATLQSLIVRYFPYPPTQFDSTTTPGDIYDFVVVGAGCGGSVVASRLSETGASVLLLEAGGSAAPETVSAALVTTRFIRNEEWIIPVKSQENAFLAYTNNATKMRLGRAMGGGTSVGNLIYNRGNKMDFDSWARMGNPGWGYDDVLPYFKKSEKYNDHTVPVDGHYHGSSGPLKVEMSRVPNKLIEQVLRAGHQMGFRTVDPNGKHQIGFTSTFRTIDNGVRVSASESFLAPVLGRANLQVRTKAHVRRVLFNRNKRAVGVEYSLDGKRRKVMARKEVILSAGVVNTPQILMLSGVGPRRHLEQHRIRLVADVGGVGQNLQSHPIFILAFSVKEGSVLRTSESLNIEVLRQYIINQTGPVSESGTNNAYSFFNLADPSHPSWADVFIETSSTNIMAAGPDFLVPIVGLNREMFSEEGTLPTNQSNFAMAVMLARPKSKGSISLQSANPLETAVVDIKALAHPDDIRLHIEGIRKALEIANMAALKDELEVHYIPTMVNPCSQLTPLTDDYWECLVRHLVYIGYDFTGTAKMAPPSDPLGVVSPRLSVRGVTGLRVVDSSVMPQIPTGNPMAATYMVAEKGADMIKQDWGYPTQLLQ